MMQKLSHNPYFNRWFSAIVERYHLNILMEKVTILILIDGFLQYYYGKSELYKEDSHNPYFNRWFSAILTLIVF